MSAPRRKKVSLKRAITAIKKRGLVIDKIQDQDVRWLYAGYKKGAFPEDQVPNDLGPKEFITFIESVATQFQHMLVMRDGNNKTLSLLLVKQFQHILETTVYHMPWTSDRDIMLGAIYYFAGIAGEFLGIKYSNENDLAYCKQLTRYGVIKKVGVINDFYRVEGLSPDAVLFHSKEINTVWTTPLQQQMSAALS